METVAVFSVAFQIKNKMLHTQSRFIKKTVTLSRENEKKMAIPDMDRYIFDAHIRLTVNLTFGFS